MGSDADTVLDFNAVLIALMDRVGTRVRISVCAAQRPRPFSHVLDMEGTLSAGWDPAVLSQNGVEGAAIIRMADADGFALYLLPEDFKDAEVRGDRVVIRTGGVAVVVQPPFEDGSTDEAA